MTIKTRRFLFFGFLTIFLVMTPVIIFFAMGNEYDFKNRVVIRTGAIEIGNAPELANILIQSVDGEFKISKDEIITPDMIQHLIPGKYEVILSKEGYADWVKELDVESNMITLIEDIELMEKQLVKE